MEVGVAIIRMFTSVTQHGHRRIALALELSATIFCDPVFMVAFLDKLHRFIERVKERVDVPSPVGELF
jgi:hypothetical protein